MSKRTEKFQWWKSTRNGQFYWHLKGKNGEVVANGGGEGYRRRAGCLHAIGIVNGRNGFPVISITDPTR